MEKETIIGATILSIFLAAALTLVGVSIVTSGVIGANQTATITKTWVWNTEPTLYLVEISPTSIDLTPGNTTTINCTAYTWDYNGWQDINISNATFHHISVSHDSPNDNNNHYTINTVDNCSCSQVAGSTTNSSCTCQFSVWYYATNGTWICNMTVQDKGGYATERIYNFNSSNNASASISTVVALNTPAELDYGNLSVTETSTEKQANVTNFGNIPINISVRAYGGDSIDYSLNPANISMICDYNNISVAYQKYTLIGGTGYDSMTSVYNDSRSMGLDLPVRTDDNAYGNDVNTTYWRLQIPLNVGGYCNGTLEFTAVEDS